MFESQSVVKWPIEYDDAAHLRDTTILMAMVAILIFRKFNLPLP